MEEQVNLQASLEALMADDRLVDLCELQRTGDEVLDVISLSENQHSDILAWMFDAKEGHGQGDEILRDLLVAASTAALTDTSGLHKNRSTYKFFADWAPSRIRTTSFASAFTARELGIQAGERVDLFVIDAQNKFVLLIENKAGAAHTKEQLDGYRESFETAVASNSFLREFDRVHIALDREFDQDDSVVRPASDTWLHLGYDWLKASAKRALTHVERGNSSARLVVSYCNRQADWESPNAEKCLKLAIALHQAYPEAVRHLVEFSRGRLEKEWLKTKNPSAIHLFLLQNRGMVAVLKETQGMATVRSEIQARLPHLPKENLYLRRLSLDICPTGWEQFAYSDWPVFIRVRFTDYSQNKYTARLVWNANGSKDHKEAEQLRTLLTTVDSKFGTFSESSHRRVLVCKASVLKELLNKVAEMDAKLAVVLANFNKTIQ